MAQLCLTSAELSEGLSNRHALYTTLQESVKLRTACGDSPDVPAALEDLHASLEALALYLLGNFEALLSFGLRDALDVEHLFLGAAQSEKRMSGQSTVLLSLSPVKSCHICRNTYHMRMERMVVRPACLSFVTSAMLIPCC